MMIKEIVIKYLNFNYEKVLFFLFLVFFILITSELFKKNIKKNSEVLRKITHIFIGVVFMTSVFVLTKGDFLVFSALVFLFSIINNYLKIFSSFSKVKRLTYGVFLFPLSLFFLGFLYFDYKSAFVVGVAVLTLADSIAAILGKKYGKKKILVKKISYSYFYNKYYLNKKTYVGSFSFFIITFVLFMLINFINNYNSNFFELLFSTRWLIVILKIFLSSIILTFMEFILILGFDNLFLPIISAYLFSLI